MFKKLMLAGVALTSFSVAPAFAQSLVDASVDAAVLDGSVADAGADVTVGGGSLIDADVDATVLDGGIVDRTVDAGLLDGINLDGQGADGVVGTGTSSISVLNNQLNLNDQSADLTAAVSAAGDATVNALAIGNTYNLDIETAVPMNNIQVNGADQSAAGYVTAGDMDEFTSVVSAIANSASVSAADGLPIEIGSYQENFGIQSSELDANLSTITDAQLTTSSIGNTVSTAAVAPTLIAVDSDQLNGGVQSATQFLSATDGNQVNSNTVAIGNALSVSMTGVAAAGTTGWIDTRQVNDGRQVSSVSADIARVTSSAVAATAIGNTVSVSTRAAQ